MAVDDAALLERWRAGDQLAGEELFERYYEPVERFFLNKLSDQVNDLVQETFIACPEGRDRLQDARKFRSYLFTVAHNVLYGFFRRKQASDGQQLDLEDQSVFDLAPGPSTIAVRNSEERLLLEGLRRIPLPYQVLLELFYWENMTSADIAEVLDLPAGTVRSRMRKARTLLERALARLETSPEKLHTTVSGLDDWARQLRERLHQAPAAAG